MIFSFKNWDRFCAVLAKQNRFSISACEVSRENPCYLVLKHDVETCVKKAYHMAKIEHKYGHRASYYVQAYLMHDAKNIRLLQAMRDMGHEISYHYDVMDSSKGNLENAIAEFDENKMLFEKNGFPIKTVCQHGNPVMERVGYSSNRDFFRNPDVQKRYPEITDIMVNFKQHIPTEYAYFSDAGRRFQFIYDPINNDIVPSDEKNIPYDDLDAVLEHFDSEHGNIISTHPHRWTKSSLAYLIRTSVFKTVRFIAKILMKIPIVKKIMSRYYYLAKKI